VSEEAGGLKSKKVAHGKIITALHIALLAKNEFHWRKIHSKLDRWMYFGMEIWRSGDDRCN